MHHGLIQLHLETENEEALSQKLILPGTLQKLTEHAINRSLITECKPLNCTYAWVGRKPDLPVRTTRTLAAYQS